jgi:hypothetical protein
VEEEHNEGKDGEDKVEEEDNDYKEYVHNNELEGDTDDDNLGAIANIDDDDLVKDKEEDEDLPYYQVSNTEFPGQTVLSGSPAKPGTTSMTLEKAKKAMKARCKAVGECMVRYLVMLEEYSG